MDFRVYLVLFPHVSEEEVEKCRRAINFLKLIQVEFCLWSIRSAAALGSMY